MQPSLSEPEFVASAFLREGESGEEDKVYFFFTETAREYDFYEKVKVPRVARVCKVCWPCRRVSWSASPCLPSAALGGGGASLKVPFQL